MGNPKITIVGDANIGKTAYVYRISKNQYVHRYVPTTGVEINMLNLANPVSKYVLWDVSGQEKFTTVDDTVRITFMERLKNYMKGSVITMVFFDTTVQKTYTNAFTWAEKVRSIYPNMKFIFVGTKIDLKSTYQVDTNKIMEHFQAEYIEVSNLTGLNVFTPFKRIIELNMIQEPLN